MSQGTRPKGGGVTVLLTQAEGPAQGAAIGNEAGERVFLFLETNDFRRDYLAMKAKGLVFEEDLRPEDYGWVAVWREPFANRWDLLESCSDSRAIQIESHLFWIACKEITRFQPV